MTSPLPEIVPYPGNPDYGVTRCGRVFRIVRALPRGRHVPAEMKPFLRPDGYLTVRLAGPEGARHARVNRLVAETFIANPSALPEVAHWDGDPTNNREGNLRWATRAQNAADVVRLGRVARRPGERNGRAILTTEQVLAIRQARAARTVDLAAEYGVTPPAIHDIRTRRNWKHV